MSASQIVRKLSDWAGLWLAPSLWAVNMQLGQILPYRDCYTNSHISAMASFVAAVLAAVSGVVSWEGVRRVGQERVQAAIAVFAGSVSALSALVFTFALTMQGIAAVVLTGCER